MADIANLSGRAALEKVRSIAEHQIALFCTTGDGGWIETRPMATQAIDDDGTLWFFSAAESHKNRQIEIGRPVQLFYAAPNRSEYLELKGCATIQRDRQKMDELWKPMIKTWFPGGKDDPQLSLIAFKAGSGHYWDTKTNRIVQLAKIALGTLTGKPMDDGIEGALEL